MFDDTEDFEGKLTCAFKNDMKNLANLHSLTRLFKSFEFGNGSRISDEKLVLLEFKYLQNKKW